MNTKLTPIAFLPHISLTPKSITHTTFRRHPIYFWHKTHIRAVSCQLIENPCSKLLETEYVDTRTYNTFINKKAAEHFLGREIPELEHAGKLFVEKVRDVYVYYICQKCGHFGHKKTEIVFNGPFDVVSGKINTSTYRTCLNCSKSSVKMDISTELSQKNNSNEDCDFAR